MKEGEVPSALVEEKRGEAVGGEEGRLSDGVRKGGRGNLPDYDKSGTISSLRYGYAARGIYILHSVQFRYPSYSHPSIIHTGCPKFSPTISTVCSQF